MIKIVDLIKILGFSGVEDITLNTLIKSYKDNNDWYVYLTDDYSHIYKVEKSLKGIPLLFLFLVDDDEFENTGMNYVSEVINRELSRVQDDDVYEGGIPESWIMFI